MSSTTETPALTTVFTPAPTCYKTYYFDILKAPYVLGDPYNEKGCYPSGLDPIKAPVFSPAFQCPPNWTLGCSLYTSQLGAFPETVGTCCPSNYVCATEGDFAWKESFGCSSAVTDKDITISGISAKDGQTTTISRTLTADHDAVNAASVQIRWRASDTVGRTGVSSLTEPTSATRTSESPSSSASKDADQAPDSGGGLSHGAKYAIGFVVPIATIAFLVLGFLYFRQRKRLKAMQASPGDVANGYGQPPQQQYQPVPQGYAGHEYKPELAAEHRGHVEPVELNNMTSPQELPAPTR